MQQQVTKKALRELGTFIKSIVNIDGNENDSLVNDLNTELHYFIDYGLERMDAIKSCYDISQI